MLGKGEKTNSQLRLKVTFTNLGKKGTIMSYYQFDLNTLTNRYIMVNDVRLALFLKIFYNCTGYALFYYKFYPKATNRNLNYKWVKVCK